jgi:hypothetical protein
MGNKSTIQLSQETRKLLASVGRKNQTYDELILDLINTRTNSKSTGPKYNDRSFKSVSRHGGEEN